MIERRYGRHAKFKAKKPVLEFRWQEWKLQYGPQLAAGLGVSLSAGQTQALSVLATVPEGLTSLEWQTVLSANPGTFFPQRNRLLQLELVSRPTEGRGAKFYLTDDGAAVLRSSRAAE